MTSSGRMRAFASCARSAPKQKIREPNRGLRRPRRAVTASYIYVHNAAGAGRRMRTCGAASSTHALLDQAASRPRLYVDDHTRADVGRSGSPQMHSSSSSARHDTAICPHHIDAIKSGLINPLVPLTFIQHAYFFPHRASLERPCALETRARKNSGYVNAKKKKTTNNKCHRIQKKCRFPR